jgi:fructokinase
MQERENAIVCFGEILWDHLPAGRYPGGAPFNVAYHLHQQGASVAIASAVGADDPGGELLARLRGWSIPTDGISAHPQLPTGYVTAKVTPEGDASYDIAENVAWDRIELTPWVQRKAGQARAVIFGSLAQRSTFNRNSLDELLELLPPEAWRIFDVNLRAPYDDLALVGSLAQRATLLKVNSAEAARLAGVQREKTSPPAETAAQDEQYARILQRETGCRFVCVTGGSRGAGLLVSGEWHWEPGRQVAVVDTVGAGDSFLATLALHLLGKGRNAPAALAAACRVGEWVASRPGATPPYVDNTTSASRT